MPKPVGLKDKNRQAENIIVLPLAFKFVSFFLIFGIKVCGII